MKISVVIPCHNSEKWLEASIRSVLDQSYDDLEIIVVDDDSSDGSVGIARSMGSRVTVIRGTWRNGNSARNAGLARATGEWIQFLDADDYLMPGKISSQVNAAADDSDIIYSPLLVHEEAGGTESIQRPTPCTELFEQWIRWELCQTGAALWKTGSLVKIGGWKEGLPCCQDNELTLRALKSGLRFQYVDMLGAVYRIWSEDTVCRKDPLKVIHHRTALIDDCLTWLELKRASNPGIRRAAGQACFEMARTLAQHNLGEATSYFATRREHGLISIAGPAAPTSYRIAKRLVGFAMTERIARFLR